MKPFLLALQFLTTFPLNKKLVYEEKDFPRSLVFFPVVGLILGGLLFLVFQVLSDMKIDGFLINILLVFILILATGGLHLDGLADTVDALASGKSKEEMLRIMRESHIGTMGVLSLILVILGKLALLQAITPYFKKTGLIFSCFLSRYSLVCLIYFFPYARAEGKARLFFEGINSKIFFVTTLVTVSVAVLLCRLQGLIIFAGVFGFIMCAGLYIKKRIGGQTGDTLGALSELTEVLVLLFIYGIFLSV